MPQNNTTPVAATTLRQLIAAPLQAAMEAQTASSLAVAGLVKKIGFDDKQQLVMADFSHNRPGEGSMQLKVPLISLIPLNCLSIQEMNVDFNVKVSSQSRASMASRRTTTNASYQMHMQVKAVREELPDSLISELNLPSF
ncbi:DUF2589 domain-containing protein [Chitinophaga tropicalis]|uniref:DUF2589 domain-containing protein n=1 Tax=Chitinophaga tropicalis TaxID=2683588 RepID=A0A7K1U5F0_9BACT|nr:DUF2589 domain-containing protein [Chitinophaga tropicalis]MVT09592.1 DUF2589 domain-containing protein [Chitinophaga tropicalis]